MTVFYHTLLLPSVLLLPASFTAFSLVPSFIPSRRMTSSSSSCLYSSTKGTHLLTLDPSTLSKEGESRPQLAKDEDYASAILKAWTDEVNNRERSEGSRGGSVSSPLIYKSNDDDDDGSSTLYGHIYRPSISSTSAAEKYLPGIILFHTGAGPQDIFLRWKADSLVNEADIFEDGCVVFIADILGDETGWAWNDRTKYDSIRKSILVPDDNGERKRLMSRVQAAIDTLCSQPGVDPKRIAALGFCLGGHPILELARMKNPSVKTMVTFHGVFDGVTKLSPVERSSDIEKNNILVCTGEDDPFIQSDELDAAMTMCTDLGYQSKLIKFEKTRHGFTNPAQDYNPSDAFAFNDHAYTKAWSATLSLLKKALKNS